MLGTWEDSQRKHYSTNTRLYKTRRSSASAVRNSETATPHTAQQHKRDMLCDTNQAFFFCTPHTGPHRWVFPMWAIPSTGCTQGELSHGFNIHCTFISSIIITWVITGAGGLGAGEKRAGWGQSTRPQAGGPSARHGQSRRPWVRRRQGTWAELIYFSKVVLSWYFSW